MRNKCQLMNTNEYEGGIQVKKWARALYQPNLPLEENHRVTACEEHIRLSKEAATEGMVLLKNESASPGKRNQTGTFRKRYL